MFIVLVFLDSVWWILEGVLFRLLMVIVFIGCKLVVWFLLIELVVKILNDNVDRMFMVVIVVLIFILLFLFIFLLFYRKCDLCYENEYIVSNWEY